MASTHEPPIRFGRYELVSLLARGGMAEIYLGTQKVEGGLARKVVIKKILPHLCSDPQFVAMFLDEARIAMLLQHPHVAHTIDFGKEGDDYFIVLEHVDGLSLRELVKRSGGRLPIGIALRIGASVAAALAHAHSVRDDGGARLGIVHRDVSPHNVLVARDGTVKLIDFGIARAKSQVHDTEVGSMKGKFAYMAPEQFQAGPIDGRTDLFALSVVLWEILAGQRLFRGESAAETMRLICSAARPSLCAARPEIGAALEAIVHRGLSPSPDDRWPDAESLGLALEEHMAAAGLPSSGLHVGQHVRSVEASPVAIESAPTAIAAAPPPPTLAAEATVLDAAPTETSTPMSVERSARRAGARGPGPLLVVAGGVALGLVAAGALLIFRDPAPPPTLGLRATPLSTSAGAVAVRPAAPAPPASPGPSAPEALAEPAPEPVPPAAAEPTARPRAVRQSAVPGTPASLPGSRAGRPGTTGRLFVNTRPWSKVYLRGRLLGTTPLGNVEVPAGPQRITFELEDRTKVVRTVEVRTDGPTKAFLVLP